MIGRGGLAREQKRPWRHLKVWIFPHSIVKDYDPQRVQQLPFVFVDALDLAIKNCVRIYPFSSLRFEPVGKPGFRLASSLAEVVTKAFVLGKRLQLAKLAEIGDPALTDRVADRASERRICQQQPAARCDAVGLIVKALGKHL